MRQRKIQDKYQGIGLDFKRRVRCPNIMRFRYLIPLKNPALSLTLSPCKCGLVSQGTAWKTHRLRNLKQDRKSIGVFPVDNNPVCKWKEGEIKLPKRSFLIFNFYDKTLTASTEIHIVRESAMNLKHVESLI